MRDWETTVIGQWALEKLEPWSGGSKTRPGSTYKHLQQIGKNTTWRSQKSQAHSDFGHNHMSSELAQHDQIPEQDHDSKTKSWAQQMKSQVAPTVEKNTWKTRTKPATRKEVP
jgi:hypothetical protein